MHQSQQNHHNNYSTTGFLSRSLTVNIFPMPSSTTPAAPQGTAILACDVSLWCTLYINCVQNKGLSKYCFHKVFCNSHQNNCYSMTDVSLESATGDDLAAPSPVTPAAPESTAFFACGAIVCHMAHIHFISNKGLQGLSAKNALKQKLEGNHVTSIFDLGQVFLQNLQQRTIFLGHPQSNLELQKLPHLFLLVVMSIVRYKAKIISPFFAHESTPTTLPFKRL